jgi:hypothetical protein
MKRLFSLIWQSPTLMTWGSFGTRLLSVIVVLPLILNRFSTSEISLWYLLSTMIGLQLLADAGFVQTFSRLIAFAMGGAELRELKDMRNCPEMREKRQPRWETISQIVGTMRVIYLRVALGSFFLLIIFGTWALFKPVNETANITHSWIAWGVILATTTAVLLFGNRYSAYLQGTNQIALLRRWEMLTALGGIVTSFLVLIFGGRLLALVIANQTWTVLNIVRDRWLCRSMENGRFRRFTVSTINKDVFEAAWPSAWRSGLGVFMSYGLIQLSGVMYAQIESPAAVASYLLALRLIQAASQFSQAPFYTKLPVLATLRAQGNVTQQIKIAKRGMLLAYWTYIAGFLFLGFFATPILDLIHSNAKFVSPSLWALLGLAIFVERYGAMHIQLYSTTNHIIWHIANGVSGAIYVFVSLLLFPKIGVYAFPIGMLAGYVGFYSWYSASHSYRAFDLSFWRFERTTGLVPLSIMLSYSMAVFMR